MKMRKLKYLSAIGAAMLLSVGAGRAIAAETPAGTASPSANPQAQSIAPGTEISIRNWRHFKRFMPEGMVELFRQRNLFKISDDVKIDVGPTLIRPLPKNYVEATEKYASQIKLVELPAGGLSLSGYQGGRPFPNPQEPHKGWKILANFWYRYLPHLIVDTYQTGCIQSGIGGTGCVANEIVYRQLAFNTDPGIAATTPGSEDKFYTRWSTKLEPEQEKYKTTLTISYRDLAKPEETFEFVPSMRRTVPVAAGSRCAQNGNLDTTEEDSRFGFASNLTQLKVDYLGERKVLALVDSELTKARYPIGYDQPIGWPQQEWGKWQLRDVDVIAVSKLPAFAEGYCYGKRVMYIDKAFAAPVWEDVYDEDMRVWKYIGLFYKTLNVPGVGPVNTSGSQITIFWDMQNQHSSVISDPGEGRPFYVNEQAPKEFQDLHRFTTEAGLGEVIR